MFLNDLLGTSQPFCRGRARAQVGKIFLCMGAPVFRGPAAGVRRAGARLVVSTSDRGHVFVGWRSSCRVAVGFAATASTGTIGSAPHMGKTTMHWSAGQRCRGSSKWRGRVDCGADGPVGAH